MSRTPPAWTATSSARSWSLPGSAPPAEHALISLLALNGLRVSEATGADIEHLGLERGHRTLVIIRKGGKIVTIPLAPRTARAIDLAVGERIEGPIFLPPTAAPGPARRRPIVRRVARRAGITNLSAPTPCDTRSSPPPSTPACLYVTSKKPPPTPTRAPPCDTTGPEPASTGTPLTSSPRSSPEQYDNTCPRTARRTLK